MLVVVGANGRTGIEVVKEALRRGRAVRAVVRDDRDARRMTSSMFSKLATPILSTMRHWFPRSKVRRDRCNRPSDGRTGCACLR